MALVINELTGAETGGLDETDATTNGTVTTTAPATGEYIYRIPAAGGNGIQFQAFAHVSSAGNNHICGFRVRFNTGVVPSSANTMWAAQESGDLILYLELQTTSGDMILKDFGGTSLLTVTAPFSTDTWYYIEVYFSNATSGGVWELFIDDVSKGSGSSAVTSNSGTLGPFLFRNSSLPGNFDFDDVYWMSGATASSQRLGSGAKVTGYQSGNSTATSDVGSNLGTGAWNDTGDRVWSDTNVAVHTGGNGAVNFNDANSAGDDLGPSGSSDVIGTIKAAKYMHRLARGNGQGRTHRRQYGNSGDGSVDDTSISLSPTPTNFFVISEAATVVPLSTETFQMGFGKNSSGGQDTECYEMQAMLLHVDNITVTNLSDLKMPENPSHGLIIEVP